MLAAPKGGVKRRRKGKTGRGESRERENKEALEPGSREITKAEKGEIPKNTPSDQGSPIRLLSPFFSGFG
jgi:hypothetical protein